MINGIIIDPDRENAETTKIIMEDAVKNLKMYIFEPREDGVTIVPTEGIDFLMAATSTVNKKIIGEQILPFIKTILHGKEEYVTIRKNKEVLYIDRSAIIGIEVMGKHCYIYTLDNKFVITRITLHSLIDLLGEPMLIRCHKSFAVNIRYVTGVKKEGRNRWRPRFIMETDFECYISDRYAGIVLKMLEENRNSILSIFVER